MAEEQASALPEELEQWLEERAGATDQDREELLARAVATYRLLSEEEAALSGESVRPLDERLAELQRRLDELESETDDRIEDVRDRVVQVLKTAKGKADPDHDHPELAAAVDGIEAELEELSASVSELDRAVDDTEGELDALAERVDGGFENYETILTSLTDRLDEVDGKLDTLAGAVVDLRKRAVDLESAEARRTAVEEIQAEAHTHGVRKGDCESCGRGIELGLLTAPRCPGCQQPLTGVDPGGGFLRSATVTVGDQPALAGESLETETPEELFEDDE
jgi:DNA repair exonuclease SbcCD ATPase subunit